MALSDYAVLTARAVDRRREGSADDSSHYQIHVVDEQGSDYRIAVNVLSQLAPSELLYFAADDFRHPLTDLLRSTSGWTSLPSRPGAANLDFMGNRGGAVTLLDPSGLKFDGVAYTADDLPEEGWTVVF